MPAAVFDVAFHPLPMPAVLLFIMSGQVAHANATAVPVAPEALRSMHEWCEGPALYALERLLPFMTSINATLLTNAWPRQTRPTASQTQASVSASYSGRNDAPPPWNVPTASLLAPFGRDEAAVQRAFHQSTERY